MLIESFDGDNQLICDSSNFRCTTLWRTTIIQGENNNIL